jgi:hypothetical protein
VCLLVIIIYSITCDSEVNRMFNEYLLLKLVFFLNLSCPVINIGLILINTLQLRYLYRKQSQERGRTGHVTE